MENEKDYKIEKITHEYYVVKPWPKGISLPNGGGFKTTVEAIRFMDLYTQYMDLYNQLVNLDVKLKLMDVSIFPSMT